MKNKINFINYSLLVAILFSILFPAVHSFEHLSESFYEKKCIHKSYSKTDITHKHKIIDHCFACNFSLNPFTSPEILKVNFIQLTPYLVLIPSYKYKFVTNHKGFIHPDRGPPYFIV